AGITYKGRGGRRIMNDIAAIMFWTLSGLVMVLCGWQAFWQARRGAEQARYETQLLALSLHLRELYDNARCGFQTTSTDGIILDISQTELDWLGYSYKEVVGKNITELLTPESTKVFRHQRALMRECGWIRDLE